VVRKGYQREDESRYRKAWLKVPKGDEEVFLWDYKEHYFNFTQNMMNLWTWKPLCIASDLYVLTSLWPLTFIAPEFILITSWFVYTSWERVISSLFAFRGHLFSLLPLVLELTVSLTELQLSKRAFKEILIDRTLHFSQISFLSTLSHLKCRRPMTQFYSVRCTWYTHRQEWTDVRPQTEWFQ